MRFYALSVGLLAIVSAVCCEVFYEEKFDTGKSRVHIRIPFSFTSALALALSLQLFASANVEFPCMQCIHRQRRRRGCDIVQSFRWLYAGEIHEIFPFKLIYAFIWFNDR